jgi:hypothetical protein
MPVFFLNLEKGKKDCENSVTKSPFLLKKQNKNKKIAKKKATHTITGNMKGRLKSSLLSYFEYCQIWLNILQDDYHLSHITKNTIIITIIIIIRIRIRI